ncbi:hypothetical protein CEXT_27311, partial [Caerostris extrusa]
GGQSAEKSKRHSRRKDMKEVGDMRPQQPLQTPSQISALVNRDIHSHLKARPCIESSPVSGTWRQDRPLKRVLSKLGFQLWASPCSSLESRQHRPNRDHYLSF